MSVRTVKASEVMTGDLVDLEGDRYADPRHDQTILEHEYARVENYERETSECIRIDFNHTSVGFPPDHELKVVKFA